MSPQEKIKQAVDRTRRANDIDEKIYRIAQQALKNCLIIPSPKFKKGDVVYNKIDLDPYYGPQSFPIGRPLYDLEEEIYYYTGEPSDHIVAEYDLEYYKDEEELP